MFCSPRKTYLIADPDKEIGNDVLTKVLKARQSNDATTLRVSSKQDVRLNFEALYYFDTIDWSLAGICSPILQNMADAELSFHAAQNTLAISDFPCHSQGVKRLIEISRASSILCLKVRHGSIISPAKSEEKFPKQDFA